MLHRLWRRLQAAAERDSDRLAKEIDEELQAHLELAAWHNRRSGASEVEARAAALARFGDPREIRRATLAQHRSRIASACVALTRFATLVALYASLVAATTVLVSLEFRDPRIAEAGEWVSLWHERGGEVETQSSYSDYLGWTRRTDVVAHVSAARYESRRLSVGGSIQRARLKLVSPGYLREHGMRPALGRPFAWGEQRADHPPLLIAHDLWTALGQPSLPELSETLRLEGQRHTIVGVLPKTFRAYYDVQFLAPLPPDEGIRAKPLLLSAQLRQDVPREAAEQVLRIGQSVPTIRLVPIRTAYARAFRPTALALVAVCTALALMGAFRLNGPPVSERGVVGLGGSDARLRPALVLFAAATALGGLVIGEALVEPLGAAVLGGSVGVFDTSSSPGVLVLLFALAFLPAVRRPGLR